ncbi:MAG: YdcF family protein [Bryobacteraceae bacterium]
MRTVLSVVLVFIVFGLIYMAIALGFYSFAPDENAKLGKVDTLIVLGYPTEPDGTPTPEQRERVMEGVREFRKGISNHIIFTGTAAHNRFIEAVAMAKLAEARGVPPSAVIEEEQAHDTIQNIYYSDKIMEAHGWHTAEVISSPYHLPRTALILSHYPDLKWEIRPAHWPPEYGLFKRLRMDWRGALLCFRIRIDGFGPSKYLPN